MSILFNRFVEVNFFDANLTIGGRAELGGSGVILPPTIEFDTHHDSDSSPNEAVIGLYNLSPLTQNKILVEGARIQLDAGYWPVGGSRFTGPIFAGQIRKASTNLVNGGTDTLTTIECGDGDDAYAHTRIRNIFRGKSHKDIALYIADAFKRRGIDIGRIEVPDFQEARPRTVDGLARRELDDIALQHDLHWSIQDGVLNIVPRDEAVNKDVYILTENTGVIGSPEFDDKGVIIDTMMVPQLRPGDTILLKNTVLTTRVPELCKIQKVDFSGSNKGGSFGARVEARYIRNDKVTRSRERLLGAVT